MSLAPIGVSTYSRLQHLKQTIEALKANTLAKESDLYIFADAPKQGDEEKVEKVRNYIHTIDGFKSVNIFDRTTNSILKNVIGGIRELLDKYGRIIFMEDDIVTAPGFLQFMNDALNFYEDDKNIIAISGYNVPANFPKSYKYDYYLSVYFNAWGFATWDDRDFMKALEYNDAYSEVMNDISLYNKTNKIHPKLINGLKQIQDGKLDAGDYKIVFHSIKNNLYTIKPIQSFVNNIGHDGSGVHCGISNKFGMINLLNKEEVRFSKGVKYDFKIDQIFYKYFHPDPSEDIKINLPGIHPMTLNFMVNDVCNSRCKMCRVWEQKREKEITPEELATILRDPLFSNLRYVGVSGGEPTLRKDLPEIFRVIADKDGIKGTGLITNALAAEHVIKQVTRCNEVCMEANLPFNVMVSLDGIGKVHDAVRGRERAFENALRVIYHIRDNTNIALSIGCTVIKQNVWHLDEVLDFCKREKVLGRFRIAEFINRLYNKDQKACIRNFDNDERYQIALFFSKLEFCYETSPHIKQTYRNIRRMIFEGKPRESGCPYQSEAVGLDSKGNLLFCSPKSPILGSCIERSAKIIYEENKALRKSIIQRYCSDCVHDYHAATSKESLMEFEQEMLLRKRMSVRQSTINASTLPAASPMPLQWSKFKKPLIVGWYGTETAGDKAIISDIIQRLKNANPQIQITIASLYPFVTSRTLYEIGAEDIRIVKTYSIEYIEACKSADVIIMGGGPLMRMEPLGFVLTAFSEARKANIPCIVEGCGIGPLIEPVEKPSAHPRTNLFKTAPGMLPVPPSTAAIDEYILAIKQILWLSTQIRVRDKASLSWVTENTARIDAICTGDPAASFVEGWKKETLHDQTIHHEEYFACFLREITFEYANGMSSTDFLVFRERFEKELGKMVCNIRKKTGLKPLLMPMHTFAVGQDDRDFARRFAKTYLQEGDYDIGNKVYSPQDILSVISRSKFNVCMRFHSVLFAEKLDIPFVAIDYTGGGKIKGFLKDQKKLEFIIDRAKISKGIWRQELDAILFKYDLKRRKEREIMTNILHIIQALGCGGGPRALIATAKHSARLGNYEHSIASLLPVDPTALELANQAGINVFVAQDNAALFKAIEQADIIHVNFWNTPEMYELFRSELPEMRLLIWFHVGGDNAPQIITPQLADFADFALPCSPYTYERQAFMELPPEERVEKVGMVYGAADFDRILDIETKEHHNFNVGYIGTATLVKMHPNYVSMSAKIDIPNVRFIVCGHTEDIFPQQAQDMGVADRFDFRGYVDDIQAVYEILDVFGYPLCPETYAAAELTLQESMYLGIPPVVFPYGGIKNLVVNDFTGLIVHSELEYKEAIEYLYHNTEERLRMGRNCREYAKQIFGAENAAKKLNPIYERMLQKPKRKRQWSQERTLSLLQQPVTLQDLMNENQGEQGLTGAEKFIESLGDKAGNFITGMNSQDTQEIFQAERKIACSPRVLFASDTGGILQYEGYYPKDPYLRLWAGLVWQQEGNHAAALSDFQSAINVGFNHWRVSWYLAQSAEKAGNMILARKSLDTVLQAAPEFTDAQEMSQRIGEIEPAGEVEKFSTACPHCNEVLYIDRKGTWQCPVCKNDFAV